MIVSPFKVANSRPHRLDTIGLLVLISTKVFPIHQVSLVGNPYLNIKSSPCVLQRKQNLLIPRFIISLCSHFQTDLFGPSLPTCVLSQRISSTYMHSALCVFPLWIIFFSISHILKNAINTKSFFL